MTGSCGRHDNYGFALSAQPGESQRRPATNSSSRLIVCIGLPAPSCSRCLCPDGHTIRHDIEHRSGTLAPRNLIPVTNPIESTFAAVPPHHPIEGLPVQQDGTRDGLQTARGRAEKLASSRWPQPVAKTRSRCDIQRRDRGHRQADRPSARNRRRLTGPVVTKNWR